VLLLLAATLQSSVLPRFGILGVHLDLVLLLIMVWSVLRGFDEALVWGLAGGVLVDLYSAGPFGVNVLALGVVAILAAVAGTTLRQARGLVLLAYSPFGTIVYQLITLFVLQNLDWRVDWPSMVALVVLPSAVLNTIFAPLVYWPLRALDERLQPQTILG
jgi:rod shape-determining protein MreD